MLSICLNGAPYTLPAGATLTVLLEHLSLTERRLAVAVNQKVIARSQHVHYCLHDGDHVEIVTAVGGG